MLKRMLMGIVILMVFQSLLHAETPTEDSVTKLYVATFNRAPDAGGLNYWLNDAGLNLESIAQSFFDQPETKEAYPADSTNASFVAAVYQNLFNRAAETAGLEYWVAELNSGNIAKSTFILAVINGALGPDATILTNKTTVGLTFANAELINLYDAEQIMLGVTDDYATVINAENAIEYLSSVYGKLSFYIRKFNGSDSTYYPSYGFTVESASYNIIKLVPDTNSGEIVDSYNTYSYSDQEIKPVTENGNVYLKKSTGSGYADGHDLSKVDPVTSQKIWTQRYGNPSYSRHVPIIDNFYFYTSVAYADFDYMAETYLAKANLNDVWTYEKLYSAPKTNLLDASLTTLYDIYKYDNILKIRTRDLDTGAYSQTLVDLILDDTDYVSYLYEFDVDRDGKTYMARIKNNTNIVEIWQIDFTKTFPDSFKYLTTYDVSKLGDWTGRTFSLDVDNGYCMLTNRMDKKVYVYDANTGWEREIDLGFQPLDAQILYQD